MNKFIFHFCISFLFIRTATAQFGNYFAGTNAGTGNTGSYVTGVGYNAVHNSNSGGFNSAFGYASLYKNTTGHGNTAQGYKSLFSNITGSNNTANGDSALYSNTTGNYNTATGYGSLYSNTTANSNTAYGSYSLYSNTVGVYNVATGYKALFSNNIGLSNTATGYNALYSNIYGDGNTASGVSALFSNIGGYDNTASGIGSLESNTSGIENTATGSYALANNTTGNHNTASGTSSLYWNSSGNFNTSIGVYSLGRNTTGLSNTASGYNALAWNQAGNENTAIGDSSLLLNEAGSNNAAIGSNAGAKQATYNKCTFLGANADASKDGLINSTAIGYGATADAKNKVRIGNNAVTSIGGQVGWTNFSDARIKKNIKENVPGLAFISLLRPVTYNFNINKEYELLGLKKDRNLDDEIEKINFTGFLAQEVDKAAQKINYAFSGIDKSGDVMGLRYSEFVVPLVKAVQELSKNEKDDIATLQKENRELKERLSKLEEIINALSSSNIMTAKSSITFNSSNASLQQNIPNPFTNSTTINYTLPHSCSSAKIIIADKSGRILKEANISGGSGSLKVDASTLAGGAYQYSLYVNDKLVDTKQMLITK